MIVTTLFSERGDSPGTFGHIEVQKDGGSDSRIAASSEAPGSIHSRYRSLSMVSFSSSNPYSCSM